MQYTVTPNEKPPALNARTPDTWERGTDPWHVSGSPPGLSDAGIWTTGGIKHGWLLLDWCGNVIGWVADGSTIEVPDIAVKEST